MKAKVGEMGVEEEVQIKEEVQENMEGMNE